MAFLDPGQPVRWWLMAIGALYGFVAQLRRWLYRQGWLATSRLPCRVVSVGNLTVGGTGKTPVVILLVEWLQAQGQRVAVLSRGYKRSGGARQLLVSDGQRLLAAASESGDEPYLIARRCPRAVVAVGADRAALGHWVLQQCPVDCIVLDDAFQHLSLARDVDVVLLDATDATGLDAMLPAGRLREPLSGLTRAAAVVITRADSRQDVYAVAQRLQSIDGLLPEPVEVAFRPESLVSVVQETSLSLSDCRGKKAWLVSGIGNSGSFQRTAASIGLTVAGETIFRDHHRYDQNDVMQVNALAEAAAADFVLTTEKDAGKLASLVTSSGVSWWALRIRADVVKGEEALRKVICSPVAVTRPEVHA
jgi:tetraacyldisaccharide 4'-kinase